MIEGNILHCDFIKISGRRVPGPYVEMRARNPRTGKESDQFFARIDTGADITVLLMDSVPAAENVEYYAAEVMDCAWRRAGIRLALKFKDNTVSTAELQREIEELSDHIPARPVELEPLNAKELLASNPQPPPMILERGLLPASGYTILGSYTKVGKTTLAIQMCLSIVSGTDFLGFRVSEMTPGKVLYCYWEGTAASMSQLIKHHKEGWGSDIANIENLILMDCHGICLQNRADLETLKRYIREHTFRISTGPSSKIKRFKSYRLEIIFTDRPEWNFVSDKGFISMGGDSLGLLGIDILKYFGFVMADGFWSLCMGE